MSKHIIWRIRTEGLVERKVCTRFVPHLSEYQKGELIFDDIKKSIHALANRSKCCTESSGTYFD